MPHYRLSYTKPHRHFIDIECRVENVVEDEIEIRLPAWRPGRYQLSDFAKNIQRFEVQDKAGKNLEFEKVAKDRWIVQTGSTDEVVVKYNYYGNTIDAGSTYLSEHQLYVNPVNCMVFLPSRMEEKCNLELDIPNDYEVATSLKKSGENAFVAAGVHELMDSPFIASPTLQHKSYDVGDTRFHMWFQGECRPDWDKLIEHFQAFSREQISHFGELPVDEYHFYFQILPEKAYHGVEHLASTVIALGPGYGIMDPDNRYRPLLGVSSHELYHSWNIKAIRPAEMMPYDYNEENYSRLGYVAEGVTSYMGDLMLLRSGVFSMEEYLEELGKYMQRHFDNDARFNMPVAEASYDTWLDGYEMGVPGRKTSIYVEGAMIALICHSRMLEKTGNKVGLDDLMRTLYERFAKEGRGYSEEEYWQTMEELAGSSFSDIREKLAYGTHDMQPYIEHALDYLGMKLALNPAIEASARKYGFRMKMLDGKQLVLRVTPDGPADNAGLAVGDELIAINGQQSISDFEGWLDYHDKVELLVKRKYETVSIGLTAADNPVYYDVAGEVNEDASDRQLQNRDAWCGTRSGEKV